MSELRCEVHSDCGAPVVAKIGLPRKHAIWACEQGFWEWHKAEDKAVFEQSTYAHIIGHCASPPRRQTIDTGEPESVTPARGDPAPPVESVGGRHADDNGFMVKWAEPIGPAECPMMVRWVWQTPLGSIRLHHFMRDDKERDPHDHPWWFVTLMLWGSYIDLTPCWHCDESGEDPADPDGSLCPKCHGMHALADSLHVGSIRFRPALHRHWVMTDNAWTLIVTGRKRRHWGFWRGSRFTPVRDYFAKVGYAPCE